MAHVYICKVENQDISGEVNFCLDNVLSEGFLDGVKRALIKPNLVCGFDARSGVTTDLALVKCLIQFLTENGVEHIFVGESSLFNTGEVFKTLGVSELEQYGASVVNFDRDEWVEVASPMPLVLEKFHLARVAFECDLFISAAKMKTHDITGVTLSIKNVLGSVSRYNRLQGHKSDINKAIVEMFAYLKKNKKFLSIVDAIYALEGRHGPTWGNPVKMDLLIASLDAVAADATCVELMGYDVNKVEHILLADKLGLGSIANREIIGESMDAVKTKFDMPSEGVLFPDFLSPLQERLFKKLPYLKFKERCTGCERCIRACPGACIAMSNGELILNYQDCISCLVCCESCLEGALDYKVKQVFIFNVAKRARDLYWKLRYGRVR